MYGYRTSSITIEEPSEVQAPAKVIGYNFRNYGNTIALISRINAAENDQPIRLEAGEAVDTRCIGGMDQTRYKVSFVSINDQDPESQQSELFVTIFAAI
jgi:hypothetical protein